MRTSSEFWDRIRRFVRAAGSVLDIAPAVDYLPTRTGAGKTHLTETATTDAGDALAGDFAAVCGDFARVGGNLAALGADE